MLYKCKVLSVVIFLKCDSDWLKIKSLSGHNSNTARRVGYGTWDLRTYLSYLALVHMYLLTISSSGTHLLTYYIEFWYMCTYLFYLVLVHMCLLILSSSGTHVLTLSSSGTHVLTYYI